MDGAQAAGGDGVRGRDADGARFVSLCERLVLERWIEQGSQTLPLLAGCVGDTQESRELAPVHISPCRFKSLWPDVDATVKKISMATIIVVFPELK